MNLFFKKELQKERITNTKIYVVKKSDLDNFLVIVGFSGDEHNARVMDNFESSIRNYLEQNFIKKMISRELKHPKISFSGQRYLRGNGKSDRTYHSGNQFHFYEGNGFKKIGRAHV